MAQLPIIAGLIGCTLGFLLFNWPSQRTRNVRAFMGDAGSTMLGFSLTWVCIELSQEPVRAISPVVTPWIFALPIHDLFSSMIRRLAQRRSPFHGDSDHLHHLLRRSGLSARRVAQVMLLSSAVFAGIGVGGHLSGVSDGWLFVSWLTVGIIYHVVFASRWAVTVGQNEPVDAATVSAEASAGSR